MRQETLFYFCIVAKLMYNTELVILHLALKLVHCLMTTTKQILHFFNILFLWNFIYYHSLNSNNTFIHIKFAMNLKKLNIMYNIFFYYLIENQNKTFFLYKIESTHYKVDNICTILLHQRVLPWIHSRSILLLHYDLLICIIIFFS